MQLVGLEQRATSSVPLCKRVVRSRKSWAMYKRERERERERERDVPIGVNAGWPTHFYASINKMNFCCSRTRMHLQNGDPRTTSFLFLSRFSVHAFVTPDSNIARFVDRFCLGMDFSTHRAVAVQRDNSQTRMDGDEPRPKGPHRKREGEDDRERPQSGSQRPAPQPRLITSTTCPVCSKAFVDRRNVLFLVVPFVLTRTKL